MDAAYVADGHLYLISETEYYRYTLPDQSNEPIPELADNGSPVTYGVAVSNTELEDLSHEKTTLTSVIETLKDTKTSNLETLLNTYEVIIKPEADGFNDRAAASYPNLADKYKVNYVVDRQANNDGTITYAGYSDTLQEYINTLENTVEPTLDNVTSLEDLEDISDHLSEVVDALGYLTQTLAFNISSLEILNDPVATTDAGVKWVSLVSDFNSSAENLQGIVDKIKTITSSSETLSKGIDAALVLDVDSSDSSDSSYYVYLFSGTEYYRLSKDTPEPDSGLLELPLKILGGWGNLPAEIRSFSGNGEDGLEAALDAAFKYVDDSEKKTLYLIQGDNGLEYDLSTYRPYETNSVMYEVIRLTSSTAEQLNQILFAGEIEDFLKMSTQEINESPTISEASSSPTNIQTASERINSEPTNSHLDFNSANGLYYWEIFFHTPFLIAQTLNTDQQFEYAKEWYEYIFDPTAISDYWKFLPFLAVDPDALLTTLTNDLDAFEALTSTDIVATARTALTNLDSMLAGYQKVFLGQEDLDTYEDASGTDLSTIATWEYVTDLEAAISNLATTADELLATWQSEMLEVVAIIKILDSRLELMRNYSAQLAEYLDDPFDPHAIAALRPIAYRKAIVMRYIDNLAGLG